jgi:hypothetical protein
MNCKPGDLAIIVRDPCPENIGRIVEVRAPALYLQDAPAWWCKALGEPLSVMLIEDPKQIFLDHQGDVYDTDLMPINGLPITDDVTDEVTA